MKYFIVAVITLLTVAGIVFIICRNDEMRLDSLGENLILSLIIITISYLTIILTDRNLQTTDKEIWSGKIEKVIHEEEWDEWIPPRTETYSTTDSKGNVTTHTRVIPGYWEHHYAENYIKTTDGGMIYVSKTPDGKRFTDSFVNSDEELAQYYPIGSPTASVHKFKNKVQASYSIYKNEEIDLDKYPDLPEYPLTVNPDYTIDRVIGKFKNKKELSKILNEINTNLNDTNNPNNKEKVKSYKQVNLILVNFGNKSKDYGLALQDYWENGAKNDLVITIGTDNKGKPTWCHVFSWSDSELLKLEIRDKILSLDNIDKDIKEALNSISENIEEKFVRKEFKDFEYLQVELKPISKVLLVVFLLIGIAIILFRF